MSRDELEARRRALKMQVDELSMAAQVSYPRLWRALCSRLTVAEQLRIDRVLAERESIRR